MTDVVGCPDENQIVDVVSGLATTTTACAIERHIDRCRDCRRLVAELMVSSIGSPAPEPAADAAHNPHIGRMLAGRFRLQQLLGRGAMGSVYAATDLVLGVQVAVKLLKPDVASQPHLLRQLHREILLGRRVSHPAICRLYDLGESRGEYFITMELVVGETLEQVLASGVVDEAKTTALLRDIAAALQAAHDADVVHRDLKPANIMIDSGGHVKIMDFGLARELGAERTWHHGPVGTPAYWAPEQARGDRTSTAADLYAFGVIALQLLGGRSDRSDADAVLRDAPSPLRALITRCLATLPANRPTAADAARLLARMRTRRGATSLRSWLVVAALGASGVAGGIAVRALADDTSSVDVAPIVRRAAAQPVDPAVVQRKLELVESAARYRFVRASDVPRIAALLEQARTHIAAGELARSAELLSDAAALVGIE